MLLTAVADIWYLTHITQMFHGKNYATSALKDPKMTLTTIMSNESHLLMLLVRPISSCHVALFYNQPLSSYKPHFESKRND